MKDKKTIKRIAVLLSPLLLFAILLIPYSILNNEVIVDWLGCGCPQIDANGNVYEPAFNANAFTACFWIFVSVCVVALSVFLSTKQLQDKLWTKIFYIDFMIAISIIITYQLCQIMMWN